MSRRSEALQPTPPSVLREYALIADGERGALVGPRGDFAWMCFPSWHSDALFSRLIGGRGSYLVMPLARHVWGGSYEEGTLIWRSRWVTDDDAVIECREALALPGERSRATVLRRICVRAGSARIRVLLDPSAAFGSEPLRSATRDDQGVWHGRTGDVRVHWSGAREAKPLADGRGGHALELELSLSEGERRDLVLELALDEEQRDPEPDERWAGTETAWRRRVPELGESAAPRDARHACAVLFGLTAESGGTVAAATTSLPERAREGRNYDYRYVWIRDQCYAGQAFARNRAGEPLDASVRFVRERLLQDGPQLKPAYTVTGGEVPPERTLSLPGYPGGTDTVGNRVREQFQLDVFGEALLLFAAAAEQERLDAEDWRAATIAADAIAQRWREPDAGIWELDPAVWTHSRLCCVAGLRRISANAGSERQAAGWLALADAIVAEASASAVHPTGRWQRTPEDERPDAALLLAAIRGAIPPDDPRSHATLRAIEDELVEDGYCYRYRPDERPLGQAEGAFLMCGHLMALAYAYDGDRVSSARWFERNRAACGPPGLFSEEFDVEQRQLRGNLPQAFVHALLLESAAVVAQER
jgi:GH15 family glucan-1,4-alpha-glucosidase